MCGHTLEPDSRSNQRGIIKSPASMAPYLPEMVSTPEGEEFAKFMDDFSRVLRGKGISGQHGVTSDQRC